MQSFGVVHAHRTSSNLLEPHQHRDSKVWSGLSHEVGVVRPYRTFPMYTATGETRSAGCLCPSSGWFKHIEPHRTSSNHNSTAIARCGEVCHMSSMCLNHPELVHKHPAHLVSQRTSANLHEPHPRRNSKVCRGLSHAFGVVRLYRTFTMYLVTGETTPN